MTNESIKKNNIYDDNVATKKDLKILGIEIESEILHMKTELENKINSITLRLGAIIVTSSGILFTLLSYFHK
jgi:hypothetical protein